MGRGFSVGFGFGIGSQDILTTFNTVNEAYKARVTTNSGMIRNNTFTLDYLNFLKRQGRLQNVKVLLGPELGSKQRSSGINKYVTRLYDASKIPTGIERVVNGGFDTNSHWTTGAGHVISDGKLNLLNAADGSFTVQAYTAIVGKYYKVTYTISNYVKGGIVVYVGASPATTVSANGTYTFIVATAQPYSMYILAKGETTLSVDNVSIQELDINDASQPTELSQPFLSGNVAPNERYALLNPNNSIRLLNHPTINFNANDEWTLTVVINNNGNTNVSGDVVGSGSTALRLINDSFDLISDSVVESYVSGVYKSQGKAIVLTYVAKGDETLDFYVNGILRNSFPPVANRTKVSFNTILGGRSSCMNGKIYSHLIQSGALSANQVKAEYDFLRKFIPEIESVQIGTQRWATSNLDIVCTPQGNLINEVQGNVNTEKITNAADREFTSDTGWWSKTSANISDGVCNMSGAAILRKDAFAKANTYYKITYTITTYISGGIRCQLVGSLGTVRRSVGTYTEFLKAPSTGSIYFTNAWEDGSFVGAIDNISIQEIGWAGSQELYDAIYAQTVGTVEQKTYAAVKAAAMWSYFNNDPTLGAVYGKLYNWFAAKLLQMDIDYYNAANLATPWGWRLPLSQDYYNLQENLGGQLVAGEKMKHADLTYWPTISNNPSGFAALQSKSRNSAGDFTNYPYIVLITLDPSYNDSYGFSITYDSPLLKIAAYHDYAIKSMGYAIRLIKS